MLRNVLIIVLALFLISFGVSRIDHTKSVVTSNYLVVNSIETQNIEEILTGIKFFIPSFAVDIMHMGTKPYLNSEGKVETFIGDALIGDSLNGNLRGSYNNNYLLPYSIAYLNNEKKLTIINKGVEGETVDTLKVRSVAEDGKPIELVLIHLR